MIGEGVKITRKPTKAGQRVWFSCAKCGNYGDASGDVEATEDVLTFFSSRHPSDCGGTS